MRIAAKSTRRERTRKRVEKRETFMDHTPETNTIEPGSGKVDVGTGGRQEAD
jgi:hypothetical protein